MTKSMHNKHNHILLDKPPIIKTIDNNWKQHKQQSCTDNQSSYPQKQ